MCPRACPSFTDEKTRLRQLRASLKRAGESLKAFEVRLLVLHADRSGSFRLMYPGVPLVPDEYLHIGRSIRQRESAAAAGCELSAVWLEETADRRARIAALRTTRLQERAPDYKGPEVNPTWALKAGRKLSKEFLRSSEDATALAADYQAGTEDRRAKIEARVAERMSHLMARKARGQALLEEFVSETAALHSAAAPRSP